MMISSFCLDLGISHALLVVFGSIRIIFGPFDISNTFVFLFLVTISIVFNLLCVLEVGIYRLLAVYFPKAIIGMNDDWFHFFFNCWNLMMAFIVSLTATNRNINLWTMLENYGHPAAFHVSLLVGQEQLIDNEK